jgi:hypothetical protein
VARKKQLDPFDELRQAIAQTNQALTNMAKICDERFTAIDLRFQEIEHGKKIRKAAKQTEKELGIE